MLPVGKNAKVVKVEYIDNGDLNVQYSEKKKAITSRDGDCKEIFVFHGTNGKQDTVTHIRVNGFRDYCCSNCSPIHPCILA